MRGKQGLENFTQDHIWPYEKGVTGNEHWVQLENLTNDDTLPSTTAKPYIVTTSNHDDLITLYQITVV